MSLPGSCIVQRGALDQLFGALRRRGYTVLGPTVREQAIVYDEISCSAELPEGWTDEQDGGRYRLRRRDDRALFGYNVGPHSWKRYQLPPEQLLWSARRDAHGGLADLRQQAPRAPRYAFLGARSCELHAMGILDRVLLGGARPDPAARARAADVFVVAVQCAQAGGTCFCVSMGTGPTAEGGFDIALTEVLEDPQRHYFLAEIGSERGAEVIDEVEHAPAGDPERDAASAAHARAAAQMGRELDVTDIRDLLYRNYEHPRWDDVAERCLSCGNCTMVCPTCFCTTVEDVTDLSGEHVERRQRWDSCFTVDYSQIHAGPVRASTRSRYRQWMTHKLATWIDQFGSSGCVGCGRCITWCPVGIDITEEVQAIRASESGAAGASGPTDGAGAGGAAGEVGAGGAAAAGR
ncbi:MAG TPA: 4Fe-4S dicluster domain-containing protein [Solirubrobacteraceae bacterium]|nr:4Fe-4S dicluster domain-containing protein [Solirubrobacteraceae bacterium]